MVYCIDAVMQTHHNVILNDHVDDLSSISKLLSTPMLQDSDLMHRIKILKVKLATCLAQIRSAVSARVEMAMTFST